MRGLQSRPLAHPARTKFVWPQPFKPSFGTSLLDPRHLSRRPATDTARGLEGMTSSAGTSTLWAATSGKLDQQPAVAISHRSDRRMAKTVQYPKVSKSVNMQLEAPVL